MNKAFTIPCITKDDVKSGQWGVERELVPSANTKREMVQSLSAELGRGYFVASGVQTIMTGSLTCLCTVVSTLPS